MDNRIVIEATESDLAECVSRYGQTAHVTLNHMIEYLRHQEKKVPPRGKEELKFLLDQGIIELVLFSEIFKTLENLEATYEIVIT